MVTCPDLYCLPHPYRVTRPTSDPWDYTIPCQSGHLYPHGDGLLAWSSDCRSPLVGRVLAVPGTVLEQDGDDGVNVSFPVSALEQVAALVHPKRKRRVSEKLRSHLTEIGRKTRFQHGVQVERHALGRDLMTLDDQSIDPTIPSVSRPSKHH